VRRLLAGAAAAISLAGAVTAWRNRGYLRRRAAQASIGPTSEPVSVLIPARNEERRLPDCLEHLARQRPDCEFEILVYDDGSSDRTQQLVHEWQAANPQVPLRVLGGREVEPPRGWLGKSWACWSLARAARTQTLVFLDADVRLHDGGLGRAVAALDALDADLLSPWPAQEQGSWLGTLIQPLQMWSWLTTVPLRFGERRGIPAMALANGQLLVARAASYFASGGHAANPSSTLDDMDLARNFRKHGYTTAVLDGAPLATCRMYDSAGALADGYAKSLPIAFGSPLRGSLIMAGLGATYVLPVLLLASRDRPTRALAATALAGAVAGRLAATRDEPATQALGHPLGISALIWVFGRAVRLNRRGATQWQGRAVAPSRG